MSRSKKGSKGPTYEYWSKRPGNQHGGLLGKATKKITHSKERAQAKQALLKEPREPEYDPREHVPCEPYLETDILYRVQKLMDWDSGKAQLWYMTPNPFFGEVSPKTMVEIGRGHKVIQFIAGREEEAQDFARRHKK